MSSNKTTNDKGKKSDEKSKSTAPKPAANTSSNSSVSHSRSNVTSSQLPKPTEKATKDRRDPASSTTSPQSTKSAQKLPETVAKTSQPTMTKQKPHYPASESKGDVEDRMGKMSIKQAPSTWEDVKKSIISGEYATLSHEELLKAIEAGTLGKGVPAKAASKDAKKPITNEKARQDAAAADKKEYIRLSKEMLVDAYFYREAGVWKETQQKIISSFRAEPVVMDYDQRCRKQGKPGIFEQAKAEAEDVAELRAEEDRQALETQAQKALRDHHVPKKLAALLGL